MTSDSDEMDKKQLDDGALLDILERANLSSYFEKFKEVY